MTQDEQKKLIALTLSLLSEAQVVEDPDHSVQNITRNLFLALKGEPFELPDHPDPNAKTYYDLMVKVFPDPTIVENTLGLVKSLTQGLCEYDEVTIMAGTLMKLTERLEAMLAVHRRLHP